MNSPNKNNGSFKTAITVTLTLSSLFGIYFLFLYLKNFPEYWRYVNVGGSWINRGATESWVSWEASKMTYSTICSIKGGNTVTSYDILGENPPGLSCEAK